MTTKELLDKAAASAKDGKYIAVVASNHQQRETFRRGLARRLNAEEAARVLLVSPHGVAIGGAFAAVFVDPLFWSTARTDEMRWFECSVRTRLAPGAPIESAPPTDLSL